MTKCKSAKIIEQSRADLCFDFSLITLPKSYSFSCETYSLEIWGEFWNDVPESLELSEFTLDDVQKLNFDGGYLAHYRNFHSGKELVFCGHVDLFPFFYCIEGNTVIFSNDFYSLVSRFKVLTLNPDAIADYFEPAWNNILKWDRTPFKEIHRLECWTYMLEGENSQPVIQSWKNLDTTIKFNEHNLEAFKHEFFECVDFYLKKIHDTSDRVMFSVSSGTDANTLAARYSQLYPDNNASFYTSKIDDVTDESKLALKMESVLQKKIILVPLKTNEFDYLELLKRHINVNLPPRFNGLINEGLLCDELVKMNVNAPSVNGMGADGKFGEFGGEYLYLMWELIGKFQIIRAFRTYKAVLISYSDYNYNRYGNLGALCKFIIILLRRCAGKIKRSILVSHKHNNNNTLLKISLPSAASSSVKTHKDAISYASQSGEIRDINIEFYRHGMKLFLPYAGYKFSQLSTNCDPFIFSDCVNKACLRYAVSDLLPPEIIANVKKSGNPAMTLKKALSANNNLEKILSYIDGRESKIVNTKKLSENFRSNDYGQKEFLALCLLIFEEKISVQMGIKINV